MGVLPKIGILPVYEGELYGAYYTCRDADGGCLDNFFLPVISSFFLLLCLGDSPISKGS